MTTVGSFSFADMNFLDTCHGARRIMFKSVLRMSLIGVVFVNLLGDARERRLAFSPQNHDLT